MPVTDDDNVLPRIVVDARLPSPRPLQSERVISKLAPTGLFELPRTHYVDLIQVRRANEHWKRERLRSGGDVRGGKCGQSECVRCTLCVRHVRDTCGLKR